MKYLIGGKGNFYKANLHTHTTISDGKFTHRVVRFVLIRNPFLNFIIVHVIIFRKLIVGSICRI